MVCQKWKEKRVLEFTSAVIQIFLNFLGVLLEILIIFYQLMKRKEGLIVNLDLFKVSGKMSWMLDLHIFIWMVMLSLG